LHAGYRDVLPDDATRLSLALEVSGCGIWEFDIATKRLYFREQMIAILGLDPQPSYTPEEVESVFHPEDRARVWEGFANAAIKGERFGIEYRIFRFGEMRWLQTQGVSVHGPDGTAVRIIGATLDVTVRKEREAALAEARDAADRANRVKSVFLANLSHEIRTPLNAILGYGEFLQDPSETGPSQSACVDGIRRNGEVLARLIEDVLDLSKVEAGRFEIEAQTFAIRDLFGELAALHVPAAQAKDLNFRVNVASDVPVLVHTDRVRLLQILHNVVGNAVKFTTTGEVRVEALVASGLGRPRLEMRISDTGPGIAAEDAERLFRPFSRAGATARRSQGSGLGLALSQRLAMMLGGDLKLDTSELGSGSTFIIDLPLVEATQMVQTPATLARAAQGAKLESALAGKRVLLVEDAPDNQIVISRMLELSGAVVEVGDSGEKAVERALAHAVDVVLMDVQLLGGIDGIEAARRLRVRGFDRPIVALTAHAMRGDRERLLAAGFDAHLAKPISRKDLVDGIGSILGQGSH